jgi:hypothetical protein
MSTITLRAGLLVACALALAARPASAQSPGQQAAYVALIYTPVAGLPPLPPVTDTTGRGGVSLLGRLGHTSRDGGALTLTSYGIGVEVPHGRMKFGATLAYLTASCGFDWQGSDQCAGDIMLGGNVRTLITSRPLDANQPKRKGATAGNAGTLVVGFEGSLGYSPRQGETAMGGAVSFPTGIALQSGTLRIMPFLTPGVAYGRLGSVAMEDDEVPTSYGAITFLIGGGLGLQFGSSGIGANVGFQRVLKGYGGATQLGIGMTWQGLTAAR